MYLGLFVNSIWIHFIPRFRNGVVAKFSGERMAAQQTLRSQPHAAQYAKSLDCFVRIHRTSRLKPAASREEHGEIRFIATKSEQRCADSCALRSHWLFRSRRKSASNAAKGAFATELFG